MISTVVGKASDLVDKRFFVSLLLPCLVFLAAISSLVITSYGWKSTYTAWQALPNGERWLILGGTISGLFFFASIVSTQINTLLRYWEGYWPWLFQRPGVFLQRIRLWRLGKSKSDWVPTRSFREFPSAKEDLLPTRLGNVLLAAENYSRDRYGLDSVFFWPRQYLLLDKDVRSLLDDARLAIDQSIVLATLSMLTAAFAVAMGLLPAIARQARVHDAIGTFTSHLSPPLTEHVWIPAAIASALLGVFSYRSAVAAAITFGDLVRSVSDLYRRDLLRRIGLTPAEHPDDEQKQWKALGQLLFRGAIDSDAEGLIRFTADSALNQLPGERTAKDTEGAEKTADIDGAGEGEH